MRATDKRHSAKTAYQSGLSAQRDRAQNILRWSWIITMMLVLIGLSTLRLG